MSVTGQSRIQSGLAHGDRSAQSADGLGSDHACGARSAKKAAARISATIIPIRTTKLRQIQHRDRARAPDGSMQLTREPLPPMTEEMKQIIEEMK